MYIHFGRYRAICEISFCRCNCRKINFYFIGHRCNFNLQVLRNLQSYRFAETRLSLTYAAIGMQRVNTYRAFIFKLFPTSRGIDTSRVWRYYATCDHVSSLKRDYRFIVATVRKSTPTSWNIDISSVCGYYVICDHVFSPKRDYG